jgi:quercetin dioxygenase-like cupin family protein
MATPTRPMPAGQDPAIVDSEHYKVELENENVRVLRIKYGPGEKSVMHGHPASVVMFLNDASFRFTFPDGRVEDGTVTAGQVMYFDALEHLPENTGSEPFEVICVELKK